MYEPINRFTPDNLPQMKNHCLHIYAPLLVLACFTSCNGQGKTSPPGDRTGGDTPAANSRLKLAGTEGARRNENIHCGVQDTAGNLWFGTSAEGVYRYDGKSFTHFTVEHGLSSNTVSAILEDAAGNLWFGTAAGICRYDGKGFVSIPIVVNSAGSFYPHGAPDNTLPGEVAVSSIVQDRTGKFWFGTANGIYRYDGKSFTHFLHGDGVENNTGLQINQVESIVEDSAGNIWFGGRGTDGLFRYDGISLTSFTPDGRNWLRPVLADKSGDIWFGTRNHSVYRYDGKTFTSFAEKELTGWVVSMAEDPAGNLWFGTEGGLCRFDGSRIITLTTRDGLINNWVYSITLDRSGKLWVGTVGMGLCSYDGKTFTSFTE